MLGPIWIIVCIDTECKHPWAFIDWYELSACSITELSQNKQVSCRKHNLCSCYRDPTAELLNINSWCFPWSLHVRTQLEPSYYVSVRRKIRINKASLSWRDLCLWQRWETTCREWGATDSSHACDAFCEWFVKWQSKESETLPICTGCTRPIVCSLLLCNNKLWKCWTQINTRNYEVRAHFSLFCACVCIINTKRTRTAVAPSNKDVNV